MRPTPQIKNRNIKTDGTGRTERVGRGSAEKGENRNGENGPNRKKMGNTKNKDTRAKQQQDKER